MASEQRFVRAPKGHRVSGNGIHRKWLETNDSMLPFEICLHLIYKCVTDLRPAAEQLHADQPTGYFLKGFAFSWRITLYKRNDLYWFYLT